MSDKQDHSTKFEKLRKKAERLIQSQPQPSDTPTLDILELIQELKIHQAELEIQNEELQRAHHEIADLQQEYENLYEFAPCGHLTLNNKGIITHLNLTGSQILDTDRKHAKLQVFSSFIDSDFEQLFFTARKKAGETGEKQSIELPIKRKDDPPLWVRADIEADRDEADTVTQWRIVLLDITVQKQAGEAIQQHSNYLSALNQASDILVDGNFEEQLHEFVKIVGAASHASRTYIFKNHNNEKESLLLSQVAEYTAPGIKPEIDNPELQNLSYEDFIPRWHKILSKGNIINGSVSEFPENEQNILEPQEIKTILVIPIIAETEFWGFIGFDNCINDEQWNKSQIEYLKEAGIKLENKIADLKSKQRLKNENKRFYAAMNSMDAGVYVSDMQTHELIFLNKYLTDLLGEITGEKCYKALQNLDSPCNFCTNHLLLDQNNNPKKPYIWEHKNRITNRWYQVRDQAIQWTDGRLVRLEVATDITERKQADAKIAASLKEKEVLLREIHHRVKNNMQVIVSLLRMHSRRIKDADLGTVFQECRDRVNAMSLIHESLYQSEDLAQIDFKTYLEKLCRNIGQAYGAKRKGVALTVDKCDVSLDMEQGIAIGMVISELVSNAFKHAFPLGKGGSVSINLSNPDERNIELIIEDDGKGMPQQIDIHKTSSLGLQLAVAAVTGELGGSIDVKRDNGTRFIIRFKYKSI